MSIYLKESRFEIMPQTFVNTEFPHTGNGVDKNSSYAVEIYGPVKSSTAGPSNGQRPALSIMVYCRNSTSSALMLH